LAEEAQALKEKLAILLSARARFKGQFSADLSWIYGYGGGATGDIWHEGAICWIKRPIRGDSQLA
jgi:hypothetical protein